MVVSGLTEQPFCGRNSVAFNGAKQDRDIQTSPSLAQPKTQINFTEAKNGSVGRDINTVMEKDLVYILENALCISLHAFERSNLNNNETTVKLMSCAFRKILFHPHKIPFGGVIMQATLKAKQTERHASEVRQVKLNTF